MRYVKQATSGYAVAIRNDDEEIACPRLEINGSKTGRGTNWTPDEDKVLLEMVQAGKSWMTIGVKLKRTMASVRQRHIKLVPSDRRTTDH